MASGKKKLKLSIKTLQRLKTWQLVVLLILCMFISATLLRLNNVGMTSRREAVLNADTAGDEQAIKNRLIDLQRYVSAHMNTDMGTIYLEGQYKRDTEAASIAAADSSAPSSDIFKKAQEICVPRFASAGGYTWAYQQCVIDELNKHPASGNLASQLQLPKVDNYRHSFVSPLWSPDFAGFSVLVCFFIVLVIVVRLIGLGVLKLILKFRYRDV